MPSMNISGVLLHARKDSTGSVVDSLGHLPGVEVHANPGDGRLVITVEGETFSAMSDAITEIQNLGGVLSTSIVYHYSDDHHEDLKQESAQ